MKLNEWLEEKKNTFCQTNVFRLIIIYFIYATNKQHMNQSKGTK